MTEKGLLGFAALRGRGTGNCRTPRTPSKPLGELNLVRFGGRIAYWVLIRMPRKCFRASGFVVAGVRRKACSHAMEAGQRWSVQEYWLARCRRHPDRRKNVGNGRSLGEQRHAEPIIAQLSRQTDDARAFRLPRSGLVHRASGCAGVVTDFAIRGPSRL